MTHERTDARTVIKSSDIRRMKLFFFFFIKRRKRIKESKYGIMTPHLIGYIFFVASACYWIKFNHVVQWINDQFNHTTECSGPGNIRYNLISSRYSRYYVQELVDLQWKCWGSDLHFLNYQTIYNKKPQESILKFYTLRC